MLSDLVCLLTVARVLIGGGGIRFVLLFSLEASIRLISSSTVAMSRLALLGWRITIDFLTEVPYNTEILDFRQLCLLPQGYKKQ